MRTSVGSESLWQPLRAMMLRFTLRMALALLKIEDGALRHNHVALVT